MIEIDANEHIIRVVRKHWFVLLGEVLILTFAVFLPGILLFVLHLVPLDQIFAFDGSTFALGGFLLFSWLLVVWIIGWNIWNNYFLNVLIVTDMRLFDIDQDGFFKRKSASFRVDHIQNVIVNQRGIIQTLLNFGNIRFETAGENINFEANHIPAPYTIKKLIDDMQDGTLATSKEVHLHPKTLERIAPIEQTKKQKNEIS